MMQGMDKMSCGNCGEQSFSMYVNRETKKLVCECDNCKSTSDLIVETPKISIKFGEESKGILCVM